MLGLYISIHIMSYVIIFPNMSTCEINTLSYTHIHIHTYTYIYTYTHTYIQSHTAKPIHILEFHSNQYKEYPKQLHL